MADERDRERTGDAPRDLDGLGRDAAHAHGDAGGATQGGSVGRRTMGNAGDDLLGIDATAGGAGDDRQQQSDDATAHQREAGMRRQGLEGKGFDAGGGYGGGGNDSLYNAEAGYGGQAGGRESSMRGAYAGDDFGRKGDDDASAGGSGQGNGGASRDADLPRGTDEQGGDASAGGGRRAGGRGDDDENKVDLDVQPDVGRRDPTR